MKWLIRIPVLILEIMFVCGWIGSIVVVILAAISETKGAVGDEDLQH